MGISALINRICKQTCVYWGSPVKSVSGGYTFDFPEEIPCRWEKKTKVMKDNNGREFISKAQVILLQDVDLQGYLFLGILNDLESDFRVPIGKKDCYQIKGFDKIPGISGNDFKRVAYL